MRIDVALSEQDAALIRLFLASTAHADACTHGALTLPKLTAMLLEDVALMVRRPGSWEGSNMAQVMLSHGYDF